MKDKLLFIIAPAIIGMIVAGLIGYSCSNNPVDKKTIVADSLAINSPVLSTELFLYNWQKEQDLKNKKLCIERGHIIRESRDYINSDRVNPEYVDEENRTLKIKSTRVAKSSSYCIRCGKVLNDIWRYDTTIVWRRK